MKTFNKLAVSVPDQIETLKRRGMEIKDEGCAHRALQLVSYYRPRGYWLPFEIRTSGDYHAFCKGTKFDDVLYLYSFDRRLRLLVLDAIEHVEIALRAQWTHYMAMKHGPHGYLEPSHYACRKHHKSTVCQLEEQFKRSKDTFTKHYRETYTPSLPPVWIATEIVSLGLLSKFYGNLKIRSERQEIAKLFKLDEKVVTSFAHHISYVRNICAHHGRLWNRRLTVKAKVPKYPPTLSGSMCDSDENRLHNTLVILGYLLESIAPGDKWKTRVMKLIDDGSLVDPIKNMGFPADWKAKPVWKV